MALRMVPQRLLQAFVRMALYSDKSQPQIAMVEDVRRRHVVSH